jgi:hypothetical protein
MGVGVDCAGWLGAPHAASNNAPATKNGITNERFVMNITSLLSQSCKGTKKFLRLCACARGDFLNSAELDGLERFEPAQ